MEIHYLDIIFYVIGLVIIWALLPEDYKFEIGGLVGCFVILVYTLLYIIIFGLFDYNIIDIYNSINIKFTL